MTKEKHKPKINVTIPQDLYDLLTEAARVTGKSRSGLIIEILQGQKGSIKFLMKAHRLIKGSKTDELLSDEDLQGGAL